MAQIVRISLLALVSTFAAFAAVLPAKAQPAMAYNWAGYYIGLNAGYGWSGDRTVNFSNVANTTLVGPTGVPSVVSFDASGAVFGGQIGYNWQSGSFLYGVEADADYANIKGRATVFGVIDARRSATGDQRLDFFGTLRGRLGMVHDRFLVFATGGLAFGHAKSAASFSNTDGCVFAGGGANQCPTGAVSKTLFGWTFGGGLEVALNASWTIKGEYLYYSLGNVSYQMTDANFPGVVYGASTDFRGHIVRGGVNYRFNWGG